MLFMVFLSLSFPHFILLLCWFNLFVAFHIVLLLLLSNLFCFSLSVYLLFLDLVFFVFVFLLIFLFLCMSVFLIPHFGFAFFYIVNFVSSKCKVRGNIFIFYRSPYAYGIIIIIPTNPNMSRPRFGQLYFHLHLCHSFPRSFNRGCVQEYYLAYCFQ